MFIAIKKRSIVLILVFVLVFSTSFAVFSRPVAVVKNGKTVVVDAGHGGIDGGVVGVNTGTKESDVNLAISRCLRQFLYMAGYEVVMTRSNSEGLYSSGDSNKKLSDMNRRREIIEQARPDLVVSVHQNWYVRPSVRGAQVFYAPKSEQGAEIAAKAQRVVNRALNCNRNPMKGDYYILQCTEYPSILIECGFMSNPEEEAMLVSADYQERAAYAIFSAIETILIGEE